MRAWTPSGRMSAKWAVVLLGLSGSAAAGCAGDATGPAPGAPRVTLSVAGSATVVSVVTRNTPLAADVTAGAWIGRRGGTIDVPGAGLRVVVPGGAVPRSTYISVRALAGSLVSYEFGPHGTQFAQPLTITQDLRDLEVRRADGSLREIEAGHFASVDDVSASAATASVNELLPVAIDVTGNRVRFNVRHFSGYLLASGRDSTTNTTTAPKAGN